MNSSMLLYTHDLSYTCDLDILLCLAMLGLNFVDYSNAVTWGHIPSLL